MTYSEYTLTFANQLNVGAQVYVRTGDLDDNIFGVLKETWAQNRTQSYQVSINSSVPLSGGALAAWEYLNSFGYDYNYGSLYVLSLSGNQVTIKSKIANLKFFDPTSPDPNIPNGPYPAIPAGVTLTINNFNGTEFKVDDVTFLQATDNSPCTHYKVQVTTSALATKVLSPSPIDPNSDNPFTVEILRGRASSVVVQSADGQQAVKYNFPSTVPGLFDIGSVNVVASPNGGTATILLDAPDSSNVYEYSVDNIAWYSSNIFTGLASGSYTAHVRDGLGCTKTKDFVVSDTGTGTPYFRYSKLNSIRMANRISHGDCANYKNDENTLSCEADVPRPWKQIQPFQTCDIIPSQFWTNYENVLATAIELDGTETNIPVIKRTNHIGLKDMRDARKYDLGGGRTGIYFITGNLYDFDTLLDTGNDYTLNGFLPEWGEVGNFIRIDSAWYLIESRLFNEDLKVDVLVITDNYSGPDTLVQVGSLYNREAYEVYEYDIDFVDFIDKTLQVKLEVTDPNYETITMLSEEIDVKVRHEHTMEIRAKHRENVGGIYFSLGFEAKIRVPIENVEGKLDNESGIAKTDTHVRLTNAELYEGDDYVLSPVTKQMMHKIVALASLSDVKFDGVGVVRRSAPTIEGPLEDTNLYDITLSMLKSESVYNSKINSDAAFAGENIEIPALVNHGDGYIRY